MAAATGRMAALICAWTGIALSVIPVAQSRSVKDLIAGLASQDPPARARAACELKEEGDMAVEAIAPLVQLLADASPVERSVCKQHWWQQSDLLTTPGQQAAAALVSIGNRTFDPLVSALHQPQWVARRNAAWALGALDDSRAVNALVAALDDREADVRAQVAWALGAIGDRAAVERLTAALKDADARVRKQAAWALGAIGDSRATDGLVSALKDTDPGVRRQAAWALGTIGR